MSTPQLPKHLMPQSVCFYRQLPNGSMVPVPEQADKVGPSGDSSEIYVMRWMHQLHLLIKRGGVLVIVVIEGDLLCQFAAAVSQVTAEVQDLPSDSHDD